LLQNADDNTFAPDVKPEVRLRFNKNYIWFWSNEVGFAKEDVDSLCAVGHSAKRGRANTIGEKGIGFKSLFKIADVVTVRSGPYSFKLDTSSKLGNLGTILPTWLDTDDGMYFGSFGIPRNGTTFVLRLRPSSYESTMSWFECLTLDFSFLLFSRKLKSIQLTEARNICPLVRRGNLKELEPGTTVVESWLNGLTQIQQQYAIFNHTVNNMPQEKNRPSQSESTVILAFPQKEGNPNLKSQDTYAFLPIDSFGFQVRTFSFHRYLLIFL
jgi:hypothetical protein